MRISRLDDVEKFKIENERLFFLSNMKRLKWV